MGAYVHLSGNGKSRGLRLPPDYNHERLREIRSILIGNIAKRDEYLDELAKLKPEMVNAKAADIVTRNKAIALSAKVLPEPAETARVQALIDDVSIRLDYFASQVVAGLTQWENTFRTVAEDIAPMVKDHALEALERYEAWHRKGAEEWQAAAAALGEVGHVYQARNGNVDLGSPAQMPADFAVPLQRLGAWIGGQAARVEQVLAPSVEVDSTRRRIPSASGGNVVDVEREALIQRAVALAPGRQGEMKEREGNVGPAKR